MLSESQINRVVGSADWKPGKGVTVPLAMLGELAAALRPAEDQF